MINLMFCGNKKVFDGMLIALLSITKHTDEALNVYVLTMDLSDENKQYIPIDEKHRNILEEKIQEKNKDSKVILIDATQYYKDDFKHSLNKKTHYTPYIFLRLLSDVIDGLPDKILYLDCDIVCYKDIKELYDIDISDFEIAWCIDYLGRTWISYDYCNSGVLLINLKKVKESGCFTDARKMVRKREMMLPDQTALNKCCTKQLILPDKFNEQNKRTDETVIRHFSMTLKKFPYPKVQNVKPWQIDDMHKKYKIHDYDDIINEYEETKKIMNKEE